MQKYHDEPKQYKGYLKSALGRYILHQPYDILVCRCRSKTKALSS